MPEFSEEQRAWLAEMNKRMESDSSRFNDDQRGWLKEMNRRAGLSGVDLKRPAESREGEGFARSIVGAKQPEGYDPGIFSALGQNLVRNIASPNNIFSSLGTEGQAAAQLGMNLLDILGSVVRAGLPDAAGKEESYTAALARGRGFSESSAGDAIKELTSNGVVIPYPSSIGEPTRLSPDFSAGALNLAGEIFTDPTTYIGIGTISKLKKVLSFGKSTEASSVVAKQILALPPGPAVAEVQEVARQVLALPPGAKFEAGSEGISRIEDFIIPGTPEQLGEEGIKVARESVELTAGKQPRQIPGEGQTTRLSEPGIKAPEQGASERARILREEQEAAAIAAAEAEAVKKSDNSAGSVRAWLMRSGHRIKSSDIEAYGFGKGSQENRSLILQLGKKDGASADELAMQAIEDGVISPPPPDTNPADWFMQKVKENDLTLERKEQLRFLDDADGEEIPAGPVNSQIEGKYNPPKVRKSEQLDIKTLKEGDVFTSDGKEVRVAFVSDEGGTRVVNLDDGRNIQLDEIFDREIAIDAGSLNNSPGKLPPDEAITESVLPGQGLLNQGQKESAKKRLQKLQRNNRLSKSEYDDAVKQIDDANSEADLLQNLANRRQFISRLQREGKISIEESQKRLSVLDEMEDGISPPRDVSPNASTPEVKQQSTDPIDGRIARLERLRDEGNIPAEQANSRIQELQTLKEKRKPPESIRIGDPSETPRKSKAPKKSQQQPDAAARQAVPKESAATPVRSRKQIIPEDSPRAGVNPSNSSPGSPVDLPEGVSPDNVGRSKLTQYPDPVQDLVNQVRISDEMEIAAQRRAGKRSLSDVRRDAAKIRDDIEKELRQGVQPGTVYNDAESYAMGEVVIRNAVDIFEDLMKGLPNNIAIGAEGVKSELGRALAMLKNMPEVDPEVLKELRKMVTGKGEIPSRKFARQVKNQGGFLNDADKAQLKEIKNQLAKKFGQLNSGIDPEVLKLYGQAAGIYIRAGARKFVDFSREMIEEFGDEVKPHLRDLYNDLRGAAGFENVKFTAESQVDQIYHAVNDINNRTELTPAAQQRMLKLLNAAGIPTVDIKPSNVEKFVEFATAAKLSGISTQVRGVLGNTGEIIMRVPEKLVAGAADRVVNAFTGMDRTVHSREAFAELFGLTTSFRRAAGRAWEALKDPSVALQEATKAGEVGVNLSGGAIGKGGRVGEALDKGLKKVTSGKIGFDAGEIVRSPFRAIGAIDIFFKELHKGAEIYAQIAKTSLENGKFGASLINDAAKKVLESPENFPELMAKAAADAKIRVFQDDIEGIAGIVNNARRKYPLLRLVIPFYNTPINLFKRSLRRTPGGTFLIPSDWNKFGYFGKRGKEGTYVGRNSREFYDLIAQQMTGTAIFSGVFWYASEGKISNRGPASRSQRETLYYTGWQPNSIKIGNTWIGYKGFEPWSSWFRTASDAVDALGTSEEKNYLDVVARLPFSFLSQFGENPFLMGVSDMADAFKDPEGYKGTTFVANLAVGSTIPTILQQWGTRVWDPTLREAKTLNEKIISRLPFGISSTLDARTNIFGEPIVRTGRAIPQALGFSISIEKDDPLSNELRRLRDADGEPIAISKPGKSINGKKLDSDAYKRYVALTGIAHKEALSTLVKSEAYKGMSEEEKVETFQETIRQVRKIVRHEEFSKYYE